jgi:hypothetical protein
LAKRQKLENRKKKFKGRANQPEIKIEKEDDEDKFEKIAEVARDWLNGKYKEDQLGQEKVKISLRALTQRENYFGFSSDGDITHSGPLKLTGKQEKTKRKLVLRKIGTVKQTSVTKLNSAISQGKKKDTSRHYQPELLKPIEERLESISEESEKESGWWINK